MERNMKKRCNENIKAIRRESGNRCEGLSGYCTALQSHGSKIR